MKEVQRWGGFFKGKKHFGFVGRGWSSEDCVAMERVQMLFEKAESFTEIYLVAV